MFGAPKPAAAAPGGFGAAPAFGTATTTAGFGGATGSAGFGSTTGGFGAAAKTGFGAAAPTTTGFGGAASNTGFGAATNTGFGAATNTGFGAASNSGFGTAAAATNNGFGAVGGMQQQQQNQQITYLQDFTRQSALASYLMELDHAYNALHPKCRFRVFVYNRCGQGQQVDAIQRERYVAFVNGGGCSEEEYMHAQQLSQDPARTYPSPLHFAQELKQRTERQKEAIAQLFSKVQDLLQDTEAVLALDAVNKAALRELQQEGTMLQRRWYALLQKGEVVRNTGRPAGEEAVLLHRARQMSQQLLEPGCLRSALAELEPYLEREAAVSAAVAHSTHTSSGGSAVGKKGSGVMVSETSGRPLLRHGVDTRVMKTWLLFAEKMQEGIEALDFLLKQDLREMKAVDSRMRG